MILLSLKRRLENAFNLLCGNQLSRLSNKLYGAPTWLPSEATSVATIAFIKIKCMPNSDFGCLGKNIENTTHNRILDLRKSFKTVFQIFQLYTNCNCCLIL